jgi:hypothetical protein
MMRCVFYAAHAHTHIHTCAQKYPTGHWLKPPGEPPGWHDCGWSVPICTYGAAFDPAHTVVPNVLPPFGDVQQMPEEHVNLINAWSHTGIFKGYRVDTSFTSFVDHAHLIPPLQPTLVVLTESAFLHALTGLDVS